MRYPTANCKNCNVKYRKDFRFCPHCGQQNKDELTVSILFYNTITNYFSFDARFFKSIPPLLFKPGYLAKSFIDGRRTTFLHPAQMYLFISVLFFFLMTTLVVSDQIKQIDKKLKNPKIVETVEAVEDSLKSRALKNNSSEQLSFLQPHLNTTLENDSLEGDQTPIPILIEENDSIEKDIISLGKTTARLLDSLTEKKVPEKEILMAMGMRENAGFFTQKLYAQGLKLYQQRGTNLLQTIYETLPFAIFILLPIFALLLKLFFYKQGVYSNHLVFSFYFFSFLFFVFTTQLITNEFVDLPTWFDSLVVFSTGLYLLLAVKQFYFSTWTSAILKTGTITFFFFLFIIPITIFILLLYGFMIY